MSSGARAKTLAFFVAIVASGFAAGAAEIRLRLRAHIPGSIVLLGDVADITDDDVRRAASLKRIELFPTPAPGRSRVLRRSEVREMLGLNGVDVTTCRISGVRLARIHAGSPQSKPSLTSPLSKRATEGTVRIVVASRALGRGEMIRPADIKLLPQEALPRGVVPVTQLGDAVGREATRAVAAGQPLDSRHLRRPILVRRGEVITVCARAAGVVVRSYARAREDASLGDLITLESLENRQRYTARVIDIQKAEVYAAGMDTSVLTEADSTAPGKTRLSSRSNKVE